MKKRRKRQQRRILSLVLIIAALVLVIACAVFVVKSKSEEEVASIDTEEGNDTEVVNTVDKSTETTTANSASGYEDIIAGTGKMSFSFYKENVYVDSEYKSYQDDLIGALSKNDYTIPEFIEEANKIFNDDNYFFAGGEVKSVGYSYLDCGKDGVKELALCFTCPIVEEESSLTMILKEIDDKVQVVYTFCGWSRSYTSLNEYGYMNGGGSSGATIHGGTVDLIDANGNYKYGYYEEEQADFDMFAEFLDHTDYDLSTVDGNIVVYSLRTTPTTQEDYEPQYYTYLVYDDNYEKIDVPNLYTDSAYKAITDCITGVSFISYDEFEKLEDNKLKEIGATEEIRNGKELEYTDIKF